MSAMTIIYLQIQNHPRRKASVGLVYFLVVEELVVGLEPDSVVDENGFESADGHLLSFLDYLMLQDLLDHFPANIKLQNVIIHIYINNHTYLYLSFLFIEMIKEQRSIFFTNLSRICVKS